MSRQAIGVGTTANDGTGDPLRTGGQSINSNFLEVYGQLPELNGIPFARDWQRVGSPEFTLTPSFDLEDFQRCSIGAATALGHPTYVVTVPLGTGNAGLHGLQGVPGVLRLNSGGASASTTIVDRGTYSGSSRNFALNNPGSVAFRFCFTGQTTLITSANYGVGLIASSVAQGTDWLTDPNTTLAGTQSWVVTRHASSYSGDGGTAGALVARGYTNAGGTNDWSYVLHATPVQSQWYTIQFALRETSIDEHWLYEDASIVNTHATPGAGNSFSVRESFICMGPSASRTLYVDAVAFEMCHVTRGV